MEAGSDDNPLKAWQTAMATAEALLEQIEGRGRTGRSRLTTDRYQELSNQAAADYQAAGMAFAEAEEALDRLAASPGRDRDLVWQGKLEKWRRDLRMARSSAQTVFRSVADGLKTRCQEAYLLGDPTDRQSDSDSKTVANLVEEKRLLSNSERLAGDSVAEGNRILGSFQRQTSLMDVGQTNAVDPRQLAEHRRRPGPEFTFDSADQPESICR